MIKPEGLKKGDKVAIVSLSSGILGEPFIKHEYELGKKRLEEEFGLEVVTMENALKGLEFVKSHPELRAKDLMDAFKDESIKAIICAIGGNDTYKLLPYIDYDIIKNNPKIFMGFSDTTTNHFMMYKAGVTSFYGPCIMCDFAEFVSMLDYTKDNIEKLLFNINETFEIKHSNYWYMERDDFSIEKINDARQPIEDEKGYEILQGKGIVTGKLLGGCIDTLPRCIENEIMPPLEDWEGALLFLETSEEKPNPEKVEEILMQLYDFGILKVINGILVGKPQDEKFYEEYKEVYKKVIGEKAKRPNLPIIYNVNFGHSYPRCILPYGIMAEINCNNKTIKLLESPVK